MNIDRSSWWWRKGRPLLTTAVSLVVAGVIFAPLQNTAWAEVRVRQPELKLKDLSDSLGQGTLLGVLGGFRSIIADFVWLRGYTFWEKHTDSASTEACAQLATTLDPRNVFFWDNGSGWIGLDIPSWRRRQLPEPTEVEMEKIERVQGLRAIDFLERGLKFVPNHPTLLRDEAMMYKRLSEFKTSAAPSDLSNAAEKWRLAANNSKDPYLAARNYLRILWQLGHLREAYDYLVKDFYPNLPDDLPDAQKGLMWGWIRGLEDALKLSPDQRQPDSKAPPNWKAEDNMDDFQSLTAPST